MAQPHLVKPRDSRRWCEGLIEQPTTLVLIEQAASEVCIVVDILYLTLHESTEYHGQ
jgi:hypothetical protein